MRPKAKPMKGLSEILFVWLVSWELRKKCVPMQSVSLKTGPVAKSTLVKNFPRLLIFTQDCFVSILFVILSFFEFFPRALGSIKSAILFPIVTYAMQLILFVWFILVGVYPPLWMKMHDQFLSSPLSDHSLSLSFLSRSLISLLPPFLPPDQSACQMHVYGWTSSMHARVTCLPLSRMKYSQAIRFVLLASYLHSKFSRNSKVNPLRTDFTAKSWLSNSKGNIATTTSSITTIDTPLERSFHYASNRKKYKVKPSQTRKLHCPEWRKSRVVNPKRKPIVFGLLSSYEVLSFASRQLVFLPSFAVYIPRLFELP